MAVRGELESFEAGWWGGCFSSWRRFGLRLRTPSVQESVPLVRSNRCVEVRGEREVGLVRLIFLFSQSNFFISRFARRKFLQRGTDSARRRRRFIHLSVLKDCDEIPSQTTARLNTDRDRPKISSPSFLGTRWRRHPLSTSPALGDLQ